MIAYLEFKLPEDRDAFKLAQRAGVMSWQIEEIQRLLRSLDKYGGVGDKSLDSLSKYEIVSFIREEVNKILAED